MKKINICILTHGRPQLFKRCIASVNNNIKTLNTLQQLAFNYIVLCDDGSVNSRQVKLDSKNVKFIAAEPCVDLSNNYKQLFTEALKTPDSYTYFLEDDDFLFADTLRTLLNAANNTHHICADNYLFNYSHGYGKLFDDNFTNNFNFLKYNNYDGKMFEVSKFVEKYDSTHYQLGMLLFKNSCLDIKKFPKGNIIENDFELLKLLSGNIKCSSKHIYQQGFFHKEYPNISDTENKNPKFTSLNDYAK